MRGSAFIFIIPLLFGLNMGALHAEDVLNLEQIVVTPNIFQIRDSSDVISDIRHTRRRI